MEERMEESWRVGRNVREAAGAERRDERWGGNEIQKKKRNNTWNGCPQGWMAEAGGAPQASATSLYRPLLLLLLAV